MWTWLSALANAFLGRVPGKAGRLDAATRMAMDADFTPRDRSHSPGVLDNAPPEVDQLEELRRLISAGDPLAPGVPPSVSRPAQRSRTDGRRRKRPSRR